MEPTRGLGGDGGFKELKSPPDLFVDGCRDGCRVLVNPYAVIELWAGQGEGDAVFFADFADTPNAGADLLDGIHAVEHADP